MCFNPYGLYYNSCQLSEEWSSVFSCRLQEIFDIVTSKNKCTLCGRQPPYPPYQGGSRIAFEHNPPLKKHFLRIGFSRSQKQPPCQAGN